MTQDEEAWILMLRKIKEAGKLEMFMVNTNKLLHAAKQGPDAIAAWKKEFLPPGKGSASKVIDMNQWKAARRKRTSVSVTA